VADTIKGYFLKRSLNQYQYQYPTQHHYRAKLSTSKLHYQARPGKAGYVDKLLMKQLQWYHGRSFSATSFKTNKPAFGAWIMLPGTFNAAQFPIWTNPIVGRN